MSIPSAKFSAIAFLGLALVALAGTEARADLYGETITASGGDVSPLSATVGPGIEFTAVVGYLDFDFGQDTLTITAPNSLGWSGFGTLTFSGFAAPISGLTLASNSGFWGGVTDPTFSGNSISFDLTQGEAYPAPTTLVFDLSGGSSPSVPDGGMTAALFAVGLAGLVALRLKRAPAV